MHDLLLIAGVAGLLTLDDRAGWQSLLGEPVFTGPLVGLLTGQPAAGFSVGVVLQLVWFSIGAARGSRRPDVVAGGVVGAAVMCLGAQRTADYVSVAPGAVMCGLLAGEAGRWIADAAGRWRERWLEGFRLPADAGAASRNLTLYTVGSALYVAMIEGLAVLVMLPVALRVSALVLGRAGAGAAGLSAWAAVLPALAVAAIVHGFATRSLFRFVLVGFVIQVVLAWLL
jgi:mannose/fructose/N-acetylgalactosamine-specific phosphotransferase system component IIC